VFGHFASFSLLMGRPPSKLHFGEVISCRRVSDGACPEPPATGENLADLARRRCVDTLESRNVETLFRVLPGTALIARVKYIAKAIALLRRRHFHLSAMAFGSRRQKILYRQEDHDLLLTAS
jgi:hypothetical protein